MKVGRVVARQSSVLEGKKRWGQSAYVELEEAGTNGCAPGGEFGCILRVLHATCHVWMLGRRQATAIAESFDFHAYLVGLVVRMKPCSVAGGHFLLAALPATLSWSPPAQILGKRSRRAPPMHERCRPSLLDWFCDHPCVLRLTFRHGAGGVTPTVLSGRAAERRGWGWGRSRKPSYEGDGSKQPRQDVRVDLRCHTPSVVREREREGEREKEIEREGEREKEIERERECRHTVGESATNPSQRARRRTLELGWHCREIGASVYRYLHRTVAADKGVCETQQVASDSSSISISSGGIGSSIRSSSSSSSSNRTKVLSDW